MPSFNQGRYLESALESVFAQNVSFEIYVMDGGSSDNSLEILKRWDSRLTGWRSGPDGGQACAINNGMRLGSAPYVCWLNSDDLFQPEGLASLLEALKKKPAAPLAYGLCWNLQGETKRQWPVNVEPFSRKRLAARCIVAQPATLIRRNAWESVGGLDESLHMALDYDLWWRLFARFGEFAFVDNYVATNRVHADTKTRNFRRLHYKEAMSVVKRHNGHVPIRWWLAQPYSIWYKALIRQFL
ncbi:glycosyltransferase family 2 protein [Shinella sedimenti]|uniref:Glycosyltransferase n=1 Tax=Shinella sedimenti TaxID=2919913 RepID=A0ABT0CS51_9HYPH|nr:glycosyltransferase family 2 protein [Shinella sedimenti]MCJ8151392.1 glycosyltransferase [Shinella sedimenti]